jgi:hypothetical protein
MEAAAIREAMHTEPFRPFTLRLADGRELPVPHPDFIAVAGNGRRVVVFSPVDDAMAILEPLLIVSFQYAATPQGPTPATENGA